VGQVEDAQSEEPQPEATMRESVHAALDSDRLHVIRDRFETLLASLDTSFEASDTAEALSDHNEELIGIEDAWFDEVESVVEAAVVACGWYVDHASTEHLAAGETPDGVPQLRLVATDGTRRSTFEVASIVGIGAGIDIG
jgi:hypothetical protein